MTDMRTQIALAIIILTVAQVILEIAIFFWWKRRRHLHLGNALVSAAEPPDKARD